VLLDDLATSCGVEQPALAGGGHELRHLPQVDGS